MRFMQLIVFIHSFFTIKVSICQTEEKEISKPYLHEINVWSSCSDTCGIGYQQKLRVCFQNGLYLVENVPFEHCSNQMTTIPTIRKCNYGDCANGFLWNTGHWTRCSHSCGNFGIQTREVDCLDSEGEIVEEKFCEKFRKPEMLRNCKRYNCPPKFVSGAWEPCISDRKCDSGIQYRSIHCVSLLDNGTIVKLPYEACYEKGLLSPANQRSCHSRKCLMEKSLNLEIKIDNRTLVQMLPMKRLDIQVGQVSHVIFGTRLSLKCSIKNYPKRNIIWIHNDQQFRYQFKTYDRLRVSKNGRMIITKFYKQDQGEWNCRAGSVAGKLTLNSRRLSEGYSDWEIRNMQLKSDLPNVLTKLSVIMKDIARWVAGKWSPCSTSCGSTGYQSRSVYCEKFYDLFYYRLDDEECLRYLEEKPIRKRQCSMPFGCPKWENINSNFSKCSNHCIGIERATMETNVKCIFQNQPIDWQKCDITTKPVMECVNIECRVKWKTSSWTQCSRSCGQNGIRARYLICVWQTTGMPAGDICNKINLKLPQVMKPCTPPKCLLKCIDIYTICEKKKKYCHIEIFYYRCCKTCRLFFQNLNHKL